jgi:hypothetical protein
MNRRETATVATRRRPRVASRAGLAGLLLVSLTTSAWAQTANWQTGTADDGQIVVKYSVSERANEDGVQVPLIEYVATTTARVSMQTCLALLKDPAMHKEFMGDKRSETLGHPSDNEWVVYNYYSAPWPFPDNDRVTRMTLAEDPTRKTAVFSFSAAPSLLEQRKVKRVTYYSAVYTLEERDAGTVALTLAMKMSPPSKAPLWMIRAAFPGVGADILRKLVKLAGRTRTP